MNIVKKIVLFFNNTSISNLPTDDWLWEDGSEMLWESSEYIKLEG